MQNNEPRAKTILRRELEKLYPVPKRELKEKWWTWIVWLLPRNLIYWSAIRLMAHASTGAWGDEHPDDISIMKALARWEKGQDGIED